MNKDNKSLLQGCLNNINHQSGLMKQCLNDNNLLQALKHCSNFLNELRINQLSPKQYYELYIAIFDSLDYLSNHLLSSYKAKQNKKSSTPFLADLYELVQYSGNIVPRLYMMIVVGTTYISTNDAPTKEIMKDMIEMCRGVQTPIRGLFLRYYLSQRIKNLLPISNKAEFNETVEFLITNFIEMNKLWVRLQHQGHSSERELRYKERKELKILVGSNLVRLSQIIDDFDQPDYSSIDYYQERIFPIITEQIIQCRDHLAQSYLIDVIIQIFPDNFHFKTLDDLLNKVFINLNPMLNKSDLIATLIERFVNYYNLESDNDKPQIQLFSTFWQFYLKLVKTDMPSEEHSLILQSFIKLSLTFEKDNFENLNTIYQFMTENFNNDDNSIDEKIWLNLLIAPIQSSSVIINLLKLPFFNEFYNKISNKLYQKQISLEILNKLLKTINGKIDIKDIDLIFKYLLILIKDSSEMNLSKKIGLVKTVKLNNEESVVTNEFLTIQSNICKLFSIIISNEPNYFEKINSLFYMKKRYLNKNLNNTIFTYPTLIQLILNNLKVIGLINFQRNGKLTSKLTTQFKNLALVIDELYQNHQTFNSMLILNLYLNCGLVADQLKLPTITEEYFNQCFVVYEESLMMNNTASTSNNNPHDSFNNNSIPYQSVILMINKLNCVRSLSQESYETLIVKLTLYGSKLLKKQDQGRSVYNSSYLWWWIEKLSHDASKELFKDPKRVLECIQKSLRVADSCIDPYLSIKLFIEILNRCLIFNIYGNNLVDDNYLNGLIDLIKTNIDNLQDDNNLKDPDDHEYKLFASIKSYFNRTMHYIDQQKQDDRFLDVVL